MAYSSLGSHTGQQFPVELAVMKLIFWFMVVGIAEMLVWLLCLIVSKSV